MQYNKAMWPLQLGAYVLGLAMILRLFVPSRGRKLYSTVSRES